MTFKTMTNHTPDQGQIQTSDWFSPEGPVAGLPTTTIIDKPTYEDSSRVIYEGSDAAEIFYMKYFYGTSKPSEVRALGGDDEVYGSNINDLVYAGNGNDRVFGSHGDDAIYGESGNDQLYGGHGDDYLVGGHGNDYLVGGDGHDTLRGTWGNDLIYGDYGNDKLTGGHGNDQLYGGAGRDLLYGLDGNDILNGEQGNDVLIGGFGADTFVVSEGQDSITDFNPIQGDKISFSNLSGQVLVYEKEGDVRIKPIYTDHLTIVKNTTGLDVVKGIVDAGNAPIWALNFETPKSLSADLGSDYDESIQFVANMTTDSSSAI